jgi:hypothetical protein
LKRGEISMKRQLGVLTLALGIAAAAGLPAASQSRDRPEAAGFTQLFMSPCGEPYRGKAGDPYPVALWFKQADLNHDGVIDRAEFRADHKGFFEALDSDDNGYLEGPELAFYEKQVAPDVFAPETLSLLAPPDRGGARLYLAQIVQQPEGGHPGEGTLRGGYTPNGGKGPGESLGARRPTRKELIGAAPFGLLEEAEPVRAADADLDGRVSKAEFLAAADRRFKLLDKNEDGKLTLDELPMTAAQVQLAKGK